MTIIITDEDVKRLLPMKDCIEAMRVAFRDFSAGIAVNRPRMRYLAKHPDPERRYLANIHVGAVPSYNIACVRAGSALMLPPGPNRDRRSYEYPSGFNWGIVILYSIATAEPLALMHEFHLSGMRVGATIGMAVDEIARPDASRLGLYGTGKQARRAAEAIACVRKLEELRLYSPNKAHRETFAREVAADLAAMGQSPRVIAMDRPRDVVEGADIVCCATNAMKPVVEGDWLAGDELVISIANSDVTNKRSEVDRRVFERSQLVIVNDWESVLDNDQNELTDLIADGTMPREKVIELGDLLTGKASAKQLSRGASGGNGLIYYKNNSGLAIQFAAAGGLLYQRAIKEGTNKSIPTEWLGSDLRPYLEQGLNPSP